MGIMGLDRNMTYSAKDIGRETVRLSVENELWISNLKLQKLLYFAWLEYFRRHGAHLFEDNFEAWKFGPVLPSVYYEYWTNAANTIFVAKRPSETIDADTSVFLLEMLQRYHGRSVHSMVDQSHRSAPWIDNYEPRAKNTIPLSDMEDWASRLRSPI